MTGNWTRRGGGACATQVKGDVRVALFSFLQSARLIGGIVLPFGPFLRVGLKWTFVREKSFDFSRQTRPVHKKALNFWRRQKKRLKFSAGVWSS